jgi:hypothetical protein
MVPLATEPLDAPVGPQLDIARGVAARPCEVDEPKHRNNLLLQPLAARARRIQRQCLNIWISWVL